MHGTSMAGKTDKPPVAPESPTEWTVAVQTRISPKAEDELVRQMKATMAPSKSHFLRKLIYAGLGLVKEEK